MAPFQKYIHENVLAFSHWQDGGHNKFLDFA